METKINKSVLNYSDAWPVYAFKSVNQTGPQYFGTF